MELTRHDVVFSVSTIYWVTGIAMWIYGTIYGAKRVITTTPSSPQLILKIIEKYQVCGV